MISLCELYAPTKQADIDPNAPLWELLADRLALPETESDKTATVQIERKQIVTMLRHACKVASKNSPKAAFQSALVSLGESFGIVASNGEAELTQGESGELSALVSPFDLSKLASKLKTESVTVEIRQPEINWKKTLKGCKASAADRPIAAGESVKDRPFEFDEKRARQFLNNRKPAPEFRIVAGSAEYILPGIGEHEFPESETFEPFATATVPAVDFRRAIEQTVYAADVESTRYALGGVYFEIEADSLVAVATDAKRLAVFDLVANTADYRAEILERWENLPEDDTTKRPVIDETQPASAVIPVPACKLALAMIPKDSTEHVTLRIGENRFSVTYNETWKLAGRLMEGRFPRYRDVIPDNSSFGHVLSFDRSALIEAIDSAMVIADDESADFVFDVNGESVTIKTRSADGRSANVAVSCRTAVDVSRVSSITFDPRFVLEYAKLAGETVSLAMIDSASAGMLFSDDSARYVLMPCSRD